MKAPKEWLAEKTEHIRYEGLPDGLLQMERFTEGDIEAIQKDAMAELRDKLDRTERELEITKGALAIAFTDGERKGRIAGLREAADLCSGDSHIEEGIRAESDRLEREEGAK